MAELLGLSAVQERAQQFAPLSLCWVQRQGPLLVLYLDGLLQAQLPELLQVQLWMAYFLIGISVRAVNTHLIDCIGIYLFQSEQLHLLTSTPLLILFSSIDLYYRSNLTL
ncbi:hypothetical protein HVZ46_16710 [Citrobacter freundii]|uniref:hypothetical protein n=1 Tax=Citrobacter freundii TaxID=546 RepID=UPI0015E91ECE|nr:hypothetical protein [Citrobacter freundii]QMD26098.1 hypothetical protein HVZ46_16710 [Citrobacter freundii]